MGEQRSVRNTTQDILSPVSDLIPVSKPSEKTSPVSLSKYKWIVLPIAGLAYYFWPKYKHQLLAENEMSNPGIKTASGGFVSKYVIPLVLAPLVYWFYNRNTQVESTLVEPMDESHKSYEKPERERRNGVNGPVGRSSKRDKSHHAVGRAPGVNNKHTGAKKPGLLKRIFTKKDPQEQAGPKKPGFLKRIFTKK